MTYTQAPRFGDGSIPGQRLDRSPRNDALVLGGLAGMAGGGLATSVASPAVRNLTDAARVHEAAAAGAGQGPISDAVRDQAKKKSARNAKLLAGAKRTRGLGVAGMAAGATAAAAGLYGMNQRRPFFPDRVDRSLPRPTSAPTIEAPSRPEYKPRQFDQLSDADREEINRMTGGRYASDLYGSQPRFGGS